MYLNDENYYSSEANWEYMSYSQYKDFCGSLGKRGCEAKAMAKLRGEYKETISEALLIGSYIDSYFEGRIELFKLKHKEIFKKAKFNNIDLKSAFVKADKIIERIERDSMFMQLLEGQKQTIFTAELFGCKWKCKLDVYRKKDRIVDLKIMKDLYERFWVKDYGFMSFIEYWGYDVQGAIYQLIESIVTGEQKLPFYVAAADKTKEPNIEIIGFSQADFDECIESVEANMPRVLEVKSGKVEPDRCGICDYCKATKELREPVYFRSLIER